MAPCIFIDNDVQKFHKFLYAYAHYKFSWPFNPLFICILFVQFGKYQHCCGLNTMETISKVKGKCIFNKIQYYENNRLVKPFFFYNYWVTKGLIFGQISMVYMPNWWQLLQFKSIIEWKCLSKNALLSKHFGTCESPVLPLSVFPHLNISINILRSIFSGSQIIQFRFPAPLPRFP